MAPLAPPAPSPSGTPHHPVVAPAAPAAPTAPAADTGAPSTPAVQRLFGRHRTTGALAAAASVAVSETLGRLQTPPPRHTPAEPPPPYAPSGPGSAVPPGGPPPSSTHVASPAQEDPPPAFTAVPAGGFDPRELSEFQLDELVHRIIGRVTRHVRTELRMDRERIGRLRDPRH
ncbi:hypothetical protein [Streptomyces ambofaciens]|uniref:hypothetical protein n=1 Tax=Streptomyces ambofaciens TaxID=1889 RepID=UPI00069EE55C|nr:hypothetical protein [Streptomyces ambofaciens]